MNSKKRKSSVQKPDSCVLGIDLGTSALKIVAISCQGRLLATARETYPTLSRFEGQAEQDPRDWLRALGSAAAQVRTQLKSVQVEAVALTGQIPTLVVLNEGKPVGNAITWQDSRADTWASERVDENVRRDVYHKTGVRIDGRYLAPMFRFHHRAKGVLILSAKDFLFYVLTGCAITDPSTASGYALYDLRTSTWDTELCKFWEIRTEQLPGVNSSSFSAPLASQASRLLGCRAGTPIVLGCADSVAGAYGIGRLQNQSVTLLTGSSTVILKCDSAPNWDPQQRFLVTPLAVKGMYGREADLLASGTALEWVQNILASGEINSKRSLQKLAYGVPPGANGLLFSPYLAGGEQGVLWNSSLRGTITGLTLSHRAPQIVRALLEGMCFEIRRCLYALEGGSNSSAVRVAGWMADIPEQGQLLADILGRPVCAFRTTSASALGAALITGHVDAKGYSRALSQIMCHPGVRLEVYNRIYEKYAARFQ